MNIKKFLPGIQKNISLRNYTTFKIGGKAKYFFLAKTKTELIKAISMAKKLNLPFFILGGGSNLLVSDEGYSGLVIKLQITNYKLQTNKIYTDAGVPLSLLISESVKNNLTGLEWAIGIPGTIGGAIRGNVGAFGFSMKEIVEKVEIFDTKDLRSKVYDVRKCKFDYRESIFKKKKNLIIVSVVLKLKKSNKREIKEKIKEYLDYRKKTQPLGLPSIGSIFKNPRLRQGFGGQASGFSAGELIEKCRLKGKRIGGAKISDIHANFIVNLGQAKARDVIKLINLAKREVKKRFGVELEEEIQYLL